MKLVQTQQLYAVQQLYATQACMWLCTVTIIKGDINHLKLKGINSLEATNLAPKGTKENESGLISTANASLNAHQLYISLCHESF